MADSRPLSALLDSRTLAVVGASSRPGSSGERVVHHLTAAGYQGEVVLVSRREAEIGGRPAYPALTDYPGSVDHALLLVPAAALEATLHDCVAKRVGAVSVFAAGFAELSGEGEQQQARLCELAATGGVRLLGPNCLGVMNARIGLMATASSALESLDVQPGPVSIVSQSGAIGMHFVVLLTQAGLGLSYYVSTGNEADVTAAEVFDHLVADESTEVVLTYLEGVRDPDRFCESLQRLRDAGKTVIAIKVGRTSRSSAAVASHTAALAGNDAVYDAVLRRLGVLRVDSLAAAVDAASLVVSGATRRHRPDRVAVVSISGGMGALMEEMLEARHYDMPVPSAAAQAAMRDLVPFCTPGNPIDVTGQITGEPDNLADFLGLTVGDRRWDAIAVLLSYTVLVPRVFETFRAALLQYATEPDVLLAVGGLFDDPQQRDLAARGILIGRDSHELVRRLDLVRSVHDLDDGRRPYRPTAVGLPPDTTLPEVAAMTWMAEAGVPMADWQPIQAPGDAASVVEKLGGAAALKVLIPSVLHKAQAGLVQTGVRAADAETVAAGMLAGQPSGAVLVAQAMAPPGGAEVILGARRDEVFGLVYVAGHGGLCTEATADTAVLLPAVTRPDFTAALSGLRNPLRTRSGTEIDEEALWQAFQALAGLTASNPNITDAELNPVIVGPPGTGAVGVDAVIRCRGSA
jgi:acetate---CoA ligase (ADP-forming)